MADVTFHLVQLLDLTVALNVGCILVKNIVIAPIVIIIVFALIFGNLWRVAC